MKQIMCVDDSPTIRMLVEKTLSPEGYGVIQAENGQDALEKMNRHEIDMFLVDVNMPVMNGFDFVRKVKEDLVMKNKPIVFLTTESSAEKKSLGKELGVKGWIVKPFESPALLKIAEMLLG